MTLFRKLALGVAGALAFIGVAQAETPETLRVATDATFMPFEYQENGKLTGFDIELVNTLAKTMGKKVEWTSIDFKGLIPGLLANRFDMAVSAIYITDERKKVVDFTDSYYPGGLVIMVKKDNDTIKGPEDLAGKKVSVQVGTKSVNYLQEKFPNVQRVEVEKNQEMFNLVEIGRVDAAVTGKPAAKVFAKNRPDVKVLDKQLTVEEYGMAVRKELPELTKELNAALAKIKADGTYDKLVKKWFESN
jgi:polar amino acid transport system substrate-binding protein